MAHYQVTVDGDVLQQLFSRDDGVARLVDQVLNQVLEAQVTEQLKARPDKRTEERQGYRNGHREKPLITRIGRLVLEVPRIRSGEFSTGRVLSVTSGASKRSCLPSWRLFRRGIDAKG